MEFCDYYAVLGVKKDAGEKEIRKAFRSLARAHHPDVNPGNAAAEARFKEINEAYEVLSDPAKRALYDQLGARWREYEQYRAAGGTATPSEFARATSGAGAGGPAGAGRGATGAPFRSGARTMSEEDLRDVFGGENPYSDFFGDLFGGGAGARTRAPRKGADSEVPVEISLEDAFRGGAVTITITASDGTTRTIEATVPRGARDGSRVRLAGQGSPGDLYMVINVRPHPTFRREGDDLHVEVPVDLYTCLLGGEAQVRTLKGTTLAVRIPPETQNGRAIRLRGQGMPRLRQPETAGDLIVSVRATLPTHLSAEERELFGRLAALRGRPAAAAGRV